MEEPSDLAGPSDTSRPIDTLLLWFYWMVDKSSLSNLSLTRLLSWLIPAFRNERIHGFVQFFVSLWALET